MHVNLFLKGEGSDYFVLLHPIVSRTSSCRRRCHKRCINGLSLFVWNDNAIRIFQSFIFCLKEILTIGIQLIYYINCLAGDRLEEHNNKSKEFIDVSRVGTTEKVIKTRDRIARSIKWALS